MGVGFRFRLDMGGGDRPASHGAETEDAAIVANLFECASKGAHLGARGGRGGLEEYVGEGDCGRVGEGGGEEGENEGDARVERV